MQNYCPYTKVILFCLALSLTPQSKIVKFSVQIYDYLSMKYSKIHVNQEASYIQ